MMQLLHVGNTISLHIELKPRQKTPSASKIKSSQTDCFKKVKIHEILKQNCITIYKSKDKFSNMIKLPGHEFNVNLTYQSTKDKSRNVYEKAC